MVDEPAGRWAGGAAAAGRRGGVGWPDPRSRSGHDPTFAPAYTNLAVIRAREGAMREAIALTERAVELDPERLTAWRNLEQFRESVGDLSGSARARAEWQRRGGR